MADRQGASNADEFPLSTQRGDPSRYDARDRLRRRREFRGDCARADAKSDREPASPFAWRGRRQRRLARSQKGEERAGGQKSRRQKSRHGESRRQESGDQAGRAEIRQAGPGRLFWRRRAFLAEGGKEKTCYALATPKAREPGKLQRDPAYIFISNRPAEKVRGEVSVIMGFAMKDGAAAHADVGGENFDLVAKGSNAWIKNPAEEARFVEALKKGSKLIVKAPVDQRQCRRPTLIPWLRILDSARQGSERLPLRSPSEDRAQRIHSSIAVRIALCPPAR